MTLIEKKALLTVIAVLITSFLVQWIRPHVENKKIYDYSLQDSLFKVFSGDTSKSDTLGLEEKLNTSQKSLRKAVSTPVKININTASQIDLEQLPRIGPATAKRIIEYRKQYGPFTSVEDLKKVKRIGPKTLKLIKPFIYIISDTSLHQ